MWKVTVTVLAAVLAVSPVSAQTLQKCVSKSGAMAFRSGPCEAGERLIALREGASDTRTSEEWRALRERQQREREGSRYLSRLAGTDGDGDGGGYSSSDPRNARVVRCEDAKRRRDADLARYRGHGRLERYSYWNRVVYDACKP